VETKTQQKQKVRPFFLYSVSYAQPLKCPTQERNKKEKKETRIVSNKSCINPSNEAKKKAVREQVFSLSFRWAAHQYFLSFWKFV
jgi:hypothetical protein